VIDWGGVLTPPLDNVIGAWMSADGITEEHFREVMRRWVGLRDGQREGEDGDADGADWDGDDADEGSAYSEAEAAPDQGPAGNSPVHRLERGEISPARFEELLAAELTALGSPVNAAGLLRRMLGGLERLDEDMAGLLRRVRAAGLRVALLSNSWGDHYPEDAWDGLFDEIVISGRVGMRKPEARIFRHAAAGLRLRTDECVMVDDLQHNVQGAIDAGMVGVLHRGYDQTRGELESIFGLTLA